MTGSILRIIYAFLGIVNIILGILGCILPILPGLIFFFLALVCFMKVSSRFKFWIHHTPTSRKLLKKMHRHRKNKRLKQAT